MGQIVIAGAGPTGLMLACELRLAGTDVLVVDRLPGRTGESRAGGIHARTMEVLDQRGILAPFLAAGRPLSGGHFAALPLDLTILPTRYPELLVLLQSEVERLLAERAAALGVPVRWGCEVVGVRQDDECVEIDVREPAGTRTLRADCLVGCDGGRSAVRKLAGISFPGTPATLTALLGDVELAEPPAESIFQQRREHGDFSVLEFEKGWYRVFTTEYDRVADRDAPVTIDDLRATMIRIAGTDFGMHSARWLSRFGDAARQADRYRDRRVLLAGDAAHIHLPAGGQGLNTGVQDAVNLGWKLATVAAGHAPDSLLDSYHTERHPVAARVLHNTRAQTALARPGPHTDALRDVITDLIGIDAVNASLSGMITALDIRYPLGDGHPLLGRRVPDVDLTTTTGNQRLYTLLHAGRPVLLTLDGAPGPATAAAGWADRIDRVTATCPESRWPIPVLGPVDAPTALLIRPDGHVAWTPSGDTTLTAALTTWCGPPR